MGSSNKNNNNDNNNDVKDEQNDRLEKKKTLIRTRNCAGLYAFKKFKHYGENNSDQRHMGYVTPTMGPYPRNGYIGDTDPR